MRRVINIPLANIVRTTQLGSGTLATRGSGQYAVLQGTKSLDSEKLCAFAPLREKTLSLDEWIGSEQAACEGAGGVKIASRKGAKAQRKIGILVNSLILDSSSGKARSRPALCRSHHHHPPDSGRGQGQRQGRAGGFGNVDGVRVGEIAWCYSEA